MTAVAVRADGELDVTGLIASIRAVSSLSQARDARANVEAARAWAKVHGEAKRLRLEILSLEVEALVRIFELDGREILTAREWEAAEWLASLAADDRQALVSDAPGNVTTATGMAHRLMRDEHESRDWRREWSRGIALASGDPTDGPSMESEYVTNVRRSMADALEDYAQAGEPFTVAEMADEVISDLGVGGQVLDHPALREGLREVCRKAVASSEIRNLDGVPIPRFVTAIEGETYIRIPTMNATVGQLAGMIALRREQIRQDTSALSQIEELHQRLVSAGGNEKSKIATVIARSKS